MTTEEFSNNFDTLIDSYKRIKKFDTEEKLDSIEFNEYEKSVFLTQAQESLIINFYNGKNSLGESFEKTEESRRYLSNLVKTYSTEHKLSNMTGISDNSVFFNLPNDLWFIIYESVHTDDNNLGCMNHKSIEVVPVTHDDYQRISNNPFRKSNKRRALRIDVEDDVVEIISEYNIDSYLIRYIAKPNPIILVDLTDDVSINGRREKTECELNSMLHEMILEEAVRIALNSKIYKTNK